MFYVKSVLLLFDSICGANFSAQIKYLCIFFVYLLRIVSIHGNKNSSYECLNYRIFFVQLFSDSFCLLLSLRSNVLYSIMLWLSLKSVFPFLFDTYILPYLMYYFIGRKFFVYLSLYFSFPIHYIKTHRIMYIFISPKHVHHFSPLRQFLQLCVGATSLNG